MRIAGSQHREVALTFDDGPGPYTPDIIRELERGHTPATFFEVGVLEKYFQGATAALVARGYPIGDHTELHANFPGYLTAQSRTAPDQTTGYVILNSRVTSSINQDAPSMDAATPGAKSSASAHNTTALGRPWRRPFGTRCSPPSEVLTPRADAALSRHCRGLRPAACSGPRNPASS